MTLQNMRALRIDATNQTAFLDVNSFGRGYQLKKFFKQSFRSIRGLQGLSLDRSETSGSSVEPANKQWPTPGQIAREVAVILIVCLCLGLAAELIVRTFGVG